MHKLVVAWLLAAFIAACSGSSNQATPSESEDVGAVKMNLELPSGVLLNSLSYTVSGGPTALTRAATVDLSNSQEAFFRIGDLPFGSGYSIALSATVQGGACEGFSTFAVVNNAEVSDVRTTLRCTIGGPITQVDRGGDIQANVDVVGGDIVHCPTVTGISALPASVKLGASISLDAHVTSPDGVVPTYQWTGSGGTFSTPTAPATSFTCTQDGQWSLGLRVGAAGCPGRTWPVNVRCGQASDPCLECLRAPTSPCHDYQSSGYDVYANCLESSDPTWNQRCEAALRCSLASQDLCAGDLVRGAISCYCSLSKSIDDCFTPVGSNPNAGPAGACIPQWEAATGCPAGDNSCVSNNFVNLTLPSGPANFLIECAAIECASACGLPHSFPPFN